MLPDWVYESRLIPAVKVRKGMLRWKVLGFDIALFWPNGDWSFGFHVMFWGHGFDVDFGPLGSSFIKEESWAWIPGR